MNRTWKAGSRRLISGLASLLLLLYLLVTVLAASPALHEMFHADARHSNHHCAVTALVSGHVDAPICDVSVCISADWSDFATPVSVSVSGGVLELLPPDRGPPSAFS